MHSVFVSNIEYFSFRILSSFEANFEFLIGALRRGRNILGKKKKNIRSPLVVVYTIRPTGHNDFNFDIHLKKKPKTK